MAGSRNIYYVSLNTVPPEIDILHYIINKIFVRHEEVISSYDKKLRQLFDVRRASPKQRTSFTGHYCRPVVRWQAIVLPNSGQFTVEPNTTLQEMLIADAAWEPSVSVQLAAVILITTSADLIKYY